MAEAQPLGRPTLHFRFFFFQAEDGIRDADVTGVQTCALPICIVLRLSSGKTMLVRGSSTDPEFQLTNAIPRDQWDQWNENRDRELERTTSYKYVDRKSVV